MDLGFNFKLTDVDADWPTTQNKQKWRELWAEDGEGKRQLIFRYLTYVQKNLQGLLMIELSTIELVRLRRCVARALEACMNSRSSHSSFHPMNEGIIQWIGECLDVPLSGFGELNDKKLIEYLRREHWRRNNGVAEITTEKKQLAVESSES